MNDKRRTLIPPIPAGAFSAFLSGLIALLAVALIAYGVALIYIPAGVITAGVGLIALQWQFFGGR